MHRVHVALSFEHGQWSFKDRTLTQPSDAIIQYYHPPPLALGQMYTVRSKPPSFIQGPFYFMSFYQDLHTASCLVMLCVRDHVQLSSPSRHQPSVPTSPYCRIKSLLAELTSSDLACLSIPRRIYTTSPSSVVVYHDFSVSTPTIADVNNKRAYFPKFFQ
jgi:hypothetical protein